MSCPQPRQMQTAMYLQNAHSLRSNSGFTYGFSLHFQCPLHMNECLLTLKMWEKIQTTYMTDESLPAPPLPPSAASVPTEPTPSPPVPSLCFTHIGLLPAPCTGQGFLVWGGKTCPSLSQEGSHLPSLPANSYPALGSQLKWTDPSGTCTPSHHLNWSPPISSLSTPIFASSASQLITSYLTSESSPHRSHMGPRPAVVTTASPTISRISQTC